MENDQVKENQLDVNICARMMFRMNFYILNCSEKNYAAILSSLPKYDYFDIVMETTPINESLIKHLIMLNFPCYQPTMIKQFINTLNPHHTSGGLIRSYLTGNGKKPKSVIFYENLWQIDLKQCLQVMKENLPQPIFEIAGEAYVEELINVFK